MLIRNRSFGLSAIGNVKPILKSLPKIFAHTDKTVRAEGTLLVLALYTYLGPAIQPALADLKPVQVTELQKQFEALNADGKGAGSGRPSRFTRQAQREREAAPPAGADGAGADGITEDIAAPTIDPRSLMDPVDVYARFPSDLDDRLASSKWKDRFEALEECNKVLADPKNARISENSVDSYGSLLSTLGTKIKSDANINVVIEAAKIIEALARGLGKPFGRYRGTVMPPCFDRLKERKATVVDAIGKALDAVFSTVSQVESRIAGLILQGAYRRDRRGHPCSMRFQEPSSKGGHTEVLASQSPDHHRSARQRTHQAHGNDSGDHVGR